MDDLDDFLDQGTQPIEPTTTEAPQPETIGQPRDESGRFAPKGVETPQETAEPVPPTGDKLPPETFKGLKEEREKRQTLERELAELRNTIQSLQQPKEPPAPPPSIWEDEQGWQQHFGQNVVSTAVQQATLNAKLDMSEMMVRQANSDFDDMKAKFLEMASQNPSLTQQALADPHPWNKAYQIAKNAAKMEALGAVDVSELEAKIRAELEAKYAASQPQTTLPTSLADAQSARSTAQQPQGLLSLEDILRPKG